VPLTTVTAATTRPHPAGSTHDLILRSARRARLEGWAQARARCPPFETHRYAMLLRVRFGCVQGEVWFCALRKESERDGDGAWRHVGLSAATLAVVDGNCFRCPAQIFRCTLEGSTLAHPAVTRSRRSARRVDRGLFALRRGAGKAGRAGRHTIACTPSGDASSAVTSAHVSLMKHAFTPPRHTADVISPHLLATGAVHRTRP